jgi:hypothetical protein
MQRVAGGDRPRLLHKNPWVLAIAGHCHIALMVQPQSNLALLVHRFRNVPKGIKMARQFSLR